MSQRLADLVLCRCGRKTGSQSCFLELGGACLVVESLVCNARALGLEGEAAGSWPQFPLLQIGTCQGTLPKEFKMCNGE